MERFSDDSLRELLEALHDKYNSPDFIADDPISVPHRYTDRADREIAGFCPENGQNQPISPIPAERSPIFVHRDARSPVFVHRRPPRDFLGLILALAVRPL